MVVDMTDDCTSDYCLKGGSCHDDFLGKTCYCLDEYTGQRCEGKCFLHASCYVYKRK